MYCKDYLHKLINEIDLCSVKIEELSHSISITVDGNKHKYQEQEGSLTDILGKTYAFEVKLNDEPIKNKSDILTKDLEECNDKGYSISKEGGSFVSIAGKDLEKGNIAYPSDFKLEQIKRKGRPKGSKNIKRKGYGFMKKSRNKSLLEKYHNESI